MWLHLGLCHAWLQLKSTEGLPDSVREGIAIYMCDYMVVASVGLLNQIVKEANPLKEEVIVKIDIN